MTLEELKVLGALEHVQELWPPQIREDAELTRWTADTALSALRTAGLIEHDRESGCYSITERGRAVLTVKRRHLRP